MLVCFRNTSDGWLRMQRRRLSGRRVQDAASSLIHDVTGRKDGDSGTVAVKQVRLLACIE